MPDACDVEQLDELESHIDQWLSSELLDNPIIASVERDVAGSRRWFVRLNGEAKDVFTVRFQLQQRTLAYETYVMPAPEENHAEFYAHLLRRNLKLFGGAFAIGDEEAIFLRGALHNDLVTVNGELDRVLGSLYQWVEQFFPPAIRIGYASKFS